VSELLGSRCFRKESEVTKLRIPLLRWMIASTRREMQLAITGNALQTNMRRPPNSRLEQAGTRPARLDRAEVGAVCSSAGR